MKFVYAPRVDLIRDPEAFFRRHGQLHVPLANHFYFFVQDVSVRAVCDLACQPGFISTPVWQREREYVVPKGLHDDVRATLRYQEIYLESKTVDKGAMLAALHRIPGYEGVLPEQISRGLQWLSSVETADETYVVLGSPSVLPQCLAIGVIFLADRYAIVDFVASEGKSWELVTVADRIQFWLDTGSITCV